MDGHFENTKKHIEDIIENHKTFFETCHKYEEIYVLGLSYNDIDKIYLQEIVKSNNDAEWYLNWHSIEDRECIEHYALSLGIRKFIKINIDEW